MNKLQIVGRSSSLFTRMPLIFAEELSVPYEIVPVFDMTVLQPEAWAGNPALKIPILRDGGAVVFGAQNICRTIAARAVTPKRIIWPEALHDNLSRNAQELVWHCMSMQVQIVMGTVVGKLPGDNVYFVKARASFEGSLRWLDSHLSAALAVLPPRDTSLFEVSLHCLLEHMAFRGTLPVDPYPSLGNFAREFAKRPSSQRTVYRFDQEPS
jgi:glutathione S-transferase